ncbi:bifunctional metallophosphatase/5'-nucleotidase [Paenibacillus herberti]|nr:bifunctional UDP-sugar hydrolase/5'-nucleotidase [Paenibacillus herberti]
MEQMDIKGWKPQLVLLHSNDVHSRLEEAARISSCVADKRRLYGESRVLYVDIGDHLDRMRQETEGTGGSVNIALLSEAGCEAAIPGNNEGLTFTKDELARLYGREARFPVLCCNMLDAETGELPEWLLPSTVIVKNGLRIALIGATAAYPAFYELLGWTVNDPTEAVREQVALLRDAADAVILLSHLGLPTDRRLAENIPGIDIILGGHTHHLLEEPELVGDTLLCGAGKFGERLGRVELAIEEATGRLLKRGSLLPLASWPMGDGAESLLREHGEAARRELSRPVAKLSRALPLDEERESPLANLLAAGVKEWTGADIGIVNAGQLLGSLPVGEISEGLLHSLCPSPINPCRMKLRGSLIREALEQSLLPEFIGKELRGFGFRGTILGTLAVDGLRIEWDPQREPGRKIIAIEYQGAELDDGLDYSVGTLDMFTFGAGYLPLKEGTDIQYFLPEFIRQVLAVELNKPHALESCFIPRYGMSKTPVE